MGEGSELDYNEVNELISKAVLLWGLWAKMGVAIMVGLVLWM